MGSTGVDGESLLQKSSTPHAANPDRFFQIATLAHCIVFTIHLHSIWAQVQEGKFPLPSRTGGSTSTVLKIEKQAHLVLENQVTIIIIVVVLVIF